MVDYVTLFSFFIRSFVLCDIFVCDILALIFFFDAVVTEALSLQDQ